MSSLASLAHIRWLLYATLFLLPLDPFLFYLPLVLCLAAVLANWKWAHEVKLSIPPLWGFPAAFLACAFLSGFGSKDPAFSLMNWAFQPLCYAVLYVLVYSLLPTRREKEMALYTFLAGAVAVMAYGFFQYAHAGEMAQDLAHEAWVDPSRFPLLRRRMYSTLENPNLFGAYLLMMVSLLSSFFLYEKVRNKKILFGVVLFFLLICTALTYSRGAWLSLAAIVLGLTLFYDKRFGFLFLLVPVVLFFYHGQIVERFLSLFSGEDTSVDLRFALWESTVAMIEEHPLLGIGWGTYFLAYPDYNFYIQDPQVLIFHAHDMYLNMLAEVGIPGGLAFIGTFFLQGVLSWKIYRQSADPFACALGLTGTLMVMAFAVMSVGDHVLFSRSISFCFWSLSALCVSGGHKVLGIRS